MRPGGRDPASTGTTARTHRTFLNEFERHALLRVHAGPEVHLTEATVAYTLLHVVQDAGAGPHRTGHGGQATVTGVVQTKRALLLKHPGRGPSVGAAQ